MKKNNREIRTVTGQDLQDMLKELLAYYYKKARKADWDTDDKQELFEAGKAAGACEALDTVFFHLYGGKAAFENWLRNVGEPEEQIANMIRGAFPGVQERGSHEAMDGR